MLNFLKGIDWETELNKHHDDVNAQWKIFKENFQDFENSCVPRKKVFINGKLSKKLSTPLDQKSLRKLKKKKQALG